jgi:hypothetical protein
MAETYAQRVGLRQPPRPPRIRVFGNFIGPPRGPEYVKWRAWVATNPRPPWESAPTEPCRHSWALWRTRVMAFGRVGLPGRYPRCSMCGEYGPRFLG